MKRDAALEESKVRACQTLGLAAAYVEAAVPILLATRPQAAQMLACSPRQVSSLIAQGELDIVVLEKRQLIVIESVRALMRRRRTTVTAETRERARQLGATACRGKS